MKKFKTYLIPVFAVLLISSSCTKEKDNISPSKTNIGADKRTNTCTFYARQVNLRTDPVGNELSSYLTCTADDGSECLYTMPQSASYGPIDIYPNVTNNLNENWSIQNWFDAVALAQQLAQTGLSTVAWPAGATDIKLDRYEVVDNILSPPTMPWRFKLNVTVHYKFCGVLGPGEDIAPGGGDVKAN